MRLTPLLVVPFLGLAGCASLNPCGSSQLDATTASVGSVPATGSVVVSTASDATYSLSPTSDQSCDAVLFGNLSPDGSSPITFEVDCAEASVLVTVPDVRFLSTGTKAVDAKITTNNGSHVCASGGATLSIETASGSTAAGPDFVTSDFLRVIAVQLDSSGWSESSSNVASDGCPAKITLDATLRFTTGSFGPAEDNTSKTSACPVLPYK